MTAKAPAPRHHIVVRNFSNARSIKTQQIADLLDVHRNSVRAKLSGTIRFNPVELELVAAALGVPRDVLSYPPVEAQRWAVDNRPEWFDDLEDDDRPVSLAEKRQQRLEAKLRTNAGVVQW